MKKYNPILIVLFQQVVKQTKSIDHTKSVIVIQLLQNAHKYGITKKSNLFKINGIVCSWEQTDTLAEGAMDLIKLKEFKNKPNFNKSY
jgi:hypothetical protein